MMEKMSVIKPGITPGTYLSLTILHIDVKNFVLKLYPSENEKLISAMASILFHVFMEVSANY